MDENRSDRAPPRALTAAVPDLLKAIWNATPPVVGTIGGRFRWRTGSGEVVAEIRRRLAWQIGPRALGVDPARARSLSLEPNAPGDRPCEIVLYPAVAEPDPHEVLGSNADLYLCLFYSLASPGPDPSSSEAARAYFRVTEALDRYQDDLSHLNPNRRVRAIDLPMPGWMRQALRPTMTNSCRILSA